MVVINTVDAKLDWGPFIFQEFAISWSSLSLSSTWLLPFSSASGLLAGSSLPRQ